MFNHFLDYFNWKKYPENVFPIALPLAITAFTLMLIQAILFIKLKNDWTYLVIFLAGITLLVFALRPVYKYFRSIRYVESPNASVS